ncbi:MAG: penicillin-binding transpeptidase domain-containing protein [bacterium]|nr:penicillin-binding transpeptidase domain-containing protein [bacterium]
MRWRRSTWRDPEIAPDEIFLDATNAPLFDRARFEGRLERPLGRSTFTFIGGVLGLVLLILVGQLWNLQIFQGTTYAAMSARNSLSSQVVFANRGVVSDVQGVPLITNEAGEEGHVVRRYLTPGLGSVLGYISYPKKDSSGNYYDTEITGLAGIEAYFNTVLGGENGTLLVERDALGEVQSQGVIISPVNGSDLALTIDMRAQKALYDAIRSLADRVPFIGGAGILMEVNTGAVRALVSYPEYDSNILSSGAPSDSIAGYNASARKPYLDRAVVGLYAPGSIVKPFEAAGALTDGIITPDVTVNSTGSISVANPYDPKHPTIFKDWKALGVVDMREAIAWSSDIYFYMVGGGYGGQKGLGIERLAYWYRVFGLESPTGVELPNESSGFVPTPAWKEKTYNEIWRIGDTYHTAIGQYAMQITPIEMARAFAAIANGGKLVKPTLIKDAPLQGESVAVSQEALRVVREGMRKGVTEGTSAGLYPLESFVHLAGKTGTAQTGVHNEFYNSWAAGFFPYENPKYVYVVVMEKGPSTNTTGGVYVMSQFLSKLHQTAPEYFE